MKNGLVYSAAIHSRRGSVVCWRDISLNLAIAMGLCHLSERSCLISHALRGDLSEWGINVAVQFE